MVNSNEFQIIKISYFVFHFMNTEDDFTVFGQNGIVDMVVIRDHIGIIRLFTSSKKRVFHDEIIAVITEENGA